MNATHLLLAQFFCLGATPRIVAFVGISLQVNMQYIQHELGSTNETAVPLAINSSSPRSRLDDLPPELRLLLVNFTPLPMRAILAHLPQFRIRSDDVLRARKLLCKWAAELGYLDLLKWAHENGFPLLQLGDGKGACVAAAQGGHLAVLQWLRQIRCRWDRWTVFAAAEGGHLEVLQWLRERGCPWDSYATTAAAEGGHLAVLQWLHANGCEWDASVTRAAAENGHLEVLEWALANGCPLATEAALVAICISGDQRMVQWALQQQLEGTLYFPAPSGLTMEVLRYLNEQRPNLAGQFEVLKEVVTCGFAFRGDLAGLQWARENGYFVPEEAWKGASAGGQLEVLKWAHQNGFPSFAGNYARLAHGGHLACLKWAVENGYRATARTCANAAQSGQLRVLQWLREEMKCEWDGDTLADALYGGHWEVFEWARQHGCLVNERLIGAAATCGYAEVLQWAFESAGASIKFDPEWRRVAANPQVLKVLRDHGCAWSEKTCAVYARRGDLEMLQWARRNGCQWNERTPRKAYEHDHVYLLKWAVENGCPMDAATRQKWSKFDLDKEFL